MNGIVRYLSWLLCLGFFYWLSTAFVIVGDRDFFSNRFDVPTYQVLVDSPDVDLLYPIGDPADPTGNGGSGIDLEDPLNLQNNVQYDPTTNSYIINNSVGGLFNYQPPTQMTLEEYIQYDMQQYMDNNWNDILQTENNADKAVIPTLQVDNKKFIDIFGPGGIDIRPTGMAELTFGINTSRTDNPQIPVRQRRITTFDFNERIQLNVIGSIGDKLKLSTSYNTEASFDFENQMKLEYKGYEDDIIQSIEAGNVSLPLSGSLITGSQSLFGIKTALRFGRLTVTSVFSQQKGKKSEVNVAGGAQVTEYEIKADAYEANKHYFASHYFRNTYDRSMRSLPTVASQVNITRIEVWITNTNNTTTDTRNIVALTDLGEVSNLQSPNDVSVAGGSLYPDNESNDLYGNVSGSAAIRSFTGATTALQSLGLVAATDFEKIENARRLTDQEFTYNALLGYISLNQSLNNDEVLAVAFQYTIGSQTYQVGEFSTDGVAGQDALVLKLLKPTITNPKNEIWDLMMKNVYAIGAYQVSPQDFQLNVWYNNPETSVLIPFLPYTGVDDVPLIQIVGLDQLNQQTSPYPDGYFDFVTLNFTENRSTNGGTINPRNGRVVFTRVEPFGSHLHSALVAEGMSTQQADLIAFQELYDSTKTVAQNTPSRNRFYIKGSYQSSTSSEISLGAFNIPKGAVTVTAGGRALQENVHYTVDYNLGRVKIIDDGLLQSQTPIKVALESNNLFNLQTKTMLGTHFDYRISKDANIGATIMRLSERPLTQKVEVNDEPIKNTQIGLDGNYQRDIPLLTKWIDKYVPFVHTKEKSTLRFAAEAAALIPGHSRAIGKEGTSYIDDFEGSQSSIDIRSFSQWTIASVPKGQSDLFPEGDLNNDVRAGYNRALISRYVIDPLFFRNNNLTPAHIANNPAIQQHHSMREVLQDEVFPNKQLLPGTPNNIAMFDVSYYPEERGPYNYDDGSDPAIAAGLNPNGGLNQPNSRWGGIMRSLNTNDWEAANIEFIQFWMMDPFNQDHDPNGTFDGGDLYFNLGNISEDILPDSRKAFEHGRAPDGTDTDLANTNWGKIPEQQAIVQAFDNDPAARIHQDVGYDLLNDDDELTYFTDYVNWVQSGGSGLTPTAQSEILADVANDNYHYYLGTNYNTAQLNILERYKRFSMQEGNSNTSEQDEELVAQGLIDNNITTSASNQPDIEDINRDNNLSESESYFQYKVSIRRQDMDEVGKNHITDIVQTTDPNGKPIRWIQFKVPVRSPEKKVNGITDFRSIRFLRLFLKEFASPVHLRFATLELIRGEWRRFEEPLLSDGEYIQGDPSSTVFNVAAVNVEQNGDRSPINYVVPPDITREIDATAANLRQLNEQSLSMEVCGLQDGDARAAYKNLDLDVRQYRRLKMFVHGEHRDPDAQAVDDDVTVFVRLGTDFTDNYYEYELPVKMTPWYSTNREEIWPAENNMEIIFEDLKNVKQNRNANINWPTNREWVETDPQNAERRIKVIGNPNLASIKTIMIGVRNPHKDADHPWKPDDGLEKCVEIWVNELRLTDFWQNGGYAALSRLSVQGADFMRFDLAGSISTPGWGNIEDRVSQRQRETIQQFDASASFELGKFFGDKIGLRLPMFLNYSVTAIDPQFDPLNPDILTKESLTFDAAKSRDYSQARAINFTNVSIARPQGKKARPWDISNWSVTYAYNELFRRDINTAYNMSRTYKGGLYYAFNSNPKLWKPFEKNKFLKKSKWFKIIRDFGIYKGPKQLAFRNDINRTDNENLIRSNFQNILKPQFNRQFNWNRGYDLKYDLTKNIKFDYHALNNAIIQEPDSLVSINRNLHPDFYQDWRDTVVNSFMSLGETMNFGHNSNLNITWPINKLPITDWVNLTTRVGTSYDWQRAPLSQDTLGHIIQNSRNVNWTGQLNFNQLYNKVPYLKKVNQKYGRNGRRKPNPRDEKKKEKEEQELKKKEAKEWPENPSNKWLEEKKMTREEYDKKRKEYFKKKKQKERDEKSFKPLEHIARFLMMTKNVSFSLQTNDGLLLPGYNQQTAAFGMNQNWTAPGWGFVFGQQNRDLWGRLRDSSQHIAEMAKENGWLIAPQYSRYVNAQYTVNHARNISGRATFEPFTGMRIELTLDRNETINTTSNFRWDDSLAVPDYTHQNLMETGMLSMSTVTWKTAFDKVEDQTFNTNTFTQLLANTALVSEVLGQEHTGSSLENDGYYSGYDTSQQEVVVGAFVTAYMGKTPDKTTINPFSAVPLPNWRVTYDGLSKIPKLKNVVQRFSLTHGYRSTMTISNFTTNLEAQIDGNGLPQTKDIGGNYLTSRQFTTVTISEQFSPLVGFDATWKVKSKGKSNGLITKVEIRKDRNLSLSLTNNQVTEVLGSELVIGSGYTFSEVPFPFKIGGDTKYSDLKLRLDLTIRGNRTITRKIIENQNQITSGQRTLSITTSGDYQLSDALTLRFYFDKVVTNPFVSTTYPTANTNAGLALRFTLQ